MSAVLARELLRQSSYVGPRGQPAPARPARTCDTCRASVEVETLDGVAWLGEHPARPGSLERCRGAGALVELDGPPRARAELRGWVRSVSIAYGTRWLDAYGREVAWLMATGAWWARGAQHPDEEAALVAAMEAR